MPLDLVDLRPPQTLVAYSDESSQDKKYFVIGASYFIPTDPSKVNTVVGKLEQRLADIKSDFGLRKTLKWEKVPIKPGKKMDGYCRVLEEFLKNSRWYFRCIVVDTHRFPLDSQRFMEGRPVIGYQKFYCVFLTDGLMKRKSYYFDIRMDQYDFPSDCPLEGFGQAVEGRFRKRAEAGSLGHAQYCELSQLSVRDHNLLQLTDLLVGSVAFVWNGGLGRSSEKAKACKTLVNLIQEKLNIDLTRPTPPSEKKFNIWEFKIPESGSRAA